jgi:hypothetical protein
MYRAKAQGKNGYVVSDESEISKAELKERWKRVAHHELVVARVNVKLVNVSQIDSSDLSAGHLSIRLRSPGRKERSFFTDILPNGNFNVAVSQRVSRFVIGSHLVSSFRFK